MQDLDWRRIRIVAFDVDGTLYAQGPLRRRMAVELLLHVIRTRSLLDLQVLKAYRQIREQLADEEWSSFDQELIDRTSHATGASPVVIEACVREWIHRRPLRHLRRCRRPGVDELFEKLRKRAIPIGIVSDYPALEKLSALGLAGDFVISATDPEIGYLKPHPAGLNELISRAGVRPDELLYIGDRPERDGEAARRAGVQFLILGSGSQGWPYINGFNDPVFSEVMSPHA